MKTFIIGRIIKIISWIYEVIPSTIKWLESKKPPIVLECLTKDELNKIKKSHCSVYEKQGMRYSTGFNCSYKSSN